MLFEVDLPFSSLSSFGTYAHTEAAMGSHNFLMSVEIVDSEDKGV